MEKFAKDNLTLQDNPQADDFHDRYKGFDDSQSVARRRNKYQALGALGGAAAGALGLPAATFGSVALAKARGKHLFGEDGMLFMGRSTADMDPKTEAKKVLSDGLLSRAIAGGVTGLGLGGSMAEATQKKRDQAVIQKRYHDSPELKDIAINSHIDVAEAIKRMNQKQSKTAMDTLAEMEKQAKVNWKHVGSVAAPAVGGAALGALLGGGTHAMKTKQSKAYAELREKYPAGQRRGNQDYANELHELHKKRARTGAIVGALGGAAYGGTLGHMVYKGEQAEAAARARREERWRQKYQEYQERQKHWEDFKQQYQNHGTGGGSSYRRPTSAEAFDAHKKNFDNLSGVNFDTFKTKAEATKAFRTAAKKYHPDLNPKGEDQFKTLNNAWEALRNSSAFDKLAFLVKQANMEKVAWETGKAIRQNAPKGALIGTGVGALAGAGTGLVKKIRQHKKDEDTYHWDQPLTKKELILSALKGGAGGAVLGAGSGTVIGGGQGLIQGGKQDLRQIKADLIDLASRVQSGGFDSVVKNPNPTTKSVAMGAMKVKDFIEKPRKIPLSISVPVSSGAVIGGIGGAWRGNRSAKEDGLEGTDKTKEILKQTGIGALLGAGSAAGTVAVRKNSRKLARTVGKAVKKTSDVVRDSAPGSTTADFIQRYQPHMVGAASSAVSSAGLNSWLKGSKAYKKSIQRGDSQQEALHSAKINAIDGAKRGAVSGAVLGAMSPEILKVLHKGVH